MISLDWPWILLALPLPLVAYWLLPAAPQAEEAALRVPNLAPFALPRKADFAQTTHAPYRLWIACLAWLLLTIAASRPVWVGEPVQRAQSGRDLMLAVDLSGSMEFEDFIVQGQRLNRLDTVKQIAGEFIERRKGDRLGLILFGSRAYLQTPLTFDRKTVNAMLQEAAIGLPGKETAIGDAIGLAVKQFLQNPDGTRVLVLLTDGANNAGEVEPLKAAELAAKHGLTIYTIGIGADSMQVPSFFGNQTINPAADMDEKSLKEIARLTGGNYFRARDTEQLVKIYNTLDELQPVDKDRQTFRPKSSLFYWPLSLCLILGAGLLLTSTKK